MSEKWLSENAQTVWYIGRNESWEGPFSQAQVLDRIRGGDLSWVDFVWRKGQIKRWLRICDIPAFQVAMPRPPSTEVLREVTRSIEMKRGSASRANSRHSIWYLQFEGSEFGPLSLQEVEVILKSGKLQGKLMAWRDGLDSWTPVSHITELVRMMEAIPLSEPYPYEDKRDERRKSPRVPLVATVRFTVQADSPSPTVTYTGVCRDISSTGMLVLCNHRPGSFNRTIRMEVIPLNSSGMNPFSCEAEVVHVLPDGRGFSVRFKSLREAEQAAIDRYLSRQSLKKAA